MVSPEDILAQISYRNLQADEYTPAVKEFKGKLEALTTSVGEPGSTGSTGGRPRTYVHFHFIDLEVIQANEPYDFPIYELRIPYSNRVKSGWGILATSAVKLLPENMDVRDTVGTVMHWKYTSGHLLWDSRERKDMERDSWEIIGVEGAGEVRQSAILRAKDILNGKTIQEFNSASLADPVIRSDTQIQQGILGRTFVKGLVDAGEVVVDEHGIYRVIS